METNTTSVELSLPPDEEYIIQIKPFGEGGEGSSSKQITIPRISGMCFAVVLEKSLLGENYWKKKCEPASYKPFVLQNFLFS